MHLSRTKLHQAGCKSLHAVICAAAPPWLNVFVLLICDGRDGAGFICTPGVVDRYAVLGTCSSYGVYLHENSRWRSGRRVRTRTTMRTYLSLCFDRNS